MNLSSHIRPLVIACSACLPFAVTFAAPERSGQHDMNFNLGSWTVHIRALHQSADDRTHWNNFEGTAVVDRVWNGRAQLEQIEADGSVGHLEALVLFLYDPSSHQWSKTFATSSDGQLGQPMYGGFTNGRGEFYDQEPFHGRMVLLRAVWTDITAASSDFEEFSSVDSGRTWKPYFVASFRRSATTPVGKSLTGRCGK